MGASSGGRLKGLLKRADRMRSSELRMYIFWSTSDSGKVIVEAAQYLGHRMLSYYMKRYKYDREMYLEAHKWR